MQKELQCIKIKDGLYLGNFKTAQDAQFLVTNKFAYIINCSAEIPNFYEGQGIKYLKFKLIKDKPHKLWDETFKKLKKLDKFIQTCQQNSMCCLIHSFDGANRSVVMLTAFLMSRYRWKLGKTLEFIRSKQIFIGLSEHYIEQLETLQQMLSTNEPTLTSQWRIQYRTTDQQILSKTFMNSQQIENGTTTKREKKTKRVQWKDIVQREKKKEQKLLVKQQLKQRGLKGQIQSQQKLAIQMPKSQQQRKQNKQNQSKQPKQPKQKQSTKKLKISNNKSKPQIQLHLSQPQKSNQPQRSLDKYKQKQQQKQAIAQQSDIDEQQIINLIKKNLKSKKKIDNGCLSIANQNQDRVYNVTINNYIKPHINIVSGGVQLEKRKVKKRPQSAWKKNKPL